MRADNQAAGEEPTQISLPFAWFARAEWVATTVVVVVQTLVVVGLLTA